MISILLPVYQVKYYLSPCLDSILGQSFTDFEVIAVDNCSTDGSFELLQDYGKKDLRLKIYQNQENKGLCYSRNRASSLATGEYLYFMDSDDVLEQNALSILHPIAQENQLDILFFQGDLWYEREEDKKDSIFQENTFQYKKVSQSVTTGQAFFEQCQENKEYQSVPWIQLIRRSFYEKHHLSFLEGQTYFEDISFTYRNLMFAQRVSCIHETLYHYRIRSHSVMTSVRKESDVLSLVESYLQILLTFQSCLIPEERQKHYLEYFFFLRFMIRMTFRLATGQEPTQAEETMINLERLFLGKPLVSLEKWSVLKEKTEYCFFGAGKESKKVLGFLKEKGFPLPLAICDNAKTLQGTEIEGIPVVSWEKARELYPNLSVLITNTRYYFEILRQVSENLPRDRILHFSF